MKCFGFSYSDKKNETPAKTPTKSIVQFGSGLNSQNVSDFPSFSRSSNLRVFTFNELKAATKNFRSSAQIGDGGFGCVYMGVIKNPRDSTKSKRLDVAVKQLRTESQGHKEWVTEVNVLGVVEHPNLVKLVGYCAEEDERGIRIQRLLVYEYMPNRSVEDHLSSRSEAPLSWPMRLKVAQDAARGLAYLHEELDSEIIFRNFKSSNILLDDQWNVKLSGFGEYPVVPDGECCVFSLSARVYVAPETFESGHISSKSDVWSYGVFLYELITGRRTFYRHVPAGEHHHLLHWVYKKKVQHIIDPRLKGTCPLKSAFALVNIANLCLNNLPSKRPKMSEVLELVNAVIGALSQPNSPAERGD